VLWYTVHSVVYTCDLILARIWLLGLCPFINRVSQWISYPPTYCSDNENKTSRNNNTKLTHTSKVTIFQAISQWKQSKMKFSSDMLFHPKCCPHWVIISEGICIPAAWKKYVWSQCEPFLNTPRLVSGTVIHP